MTVRIERREGRIVVDIRTQDPNGKRIRKRCYAPDGVTSISGATRWAEMRQRALALEGDAPKAPPAPTLKEFSERWMREYAEANRNKPSTRAAKDTILRLHLLPVLGAARLGNIGEPEIQRLKLSMSSLSPKTHACVLSQLATILKTAVRWNVISKAPLITLPRLAQREMEFYGFEEYESLLAGAARCGPVVLSAILLGGDAGLRRGELVALEQSDVGRNHLTISRNDWQGKVGTPKGGRSRRVPLTSRLQEAISAIRHLRGKRLLYRPDGEPASATTIASWMESACRKAGLPPSRNVHALRHTFISHLVMRGAPLRTVQELAGHSSITMTMKYAHLAKGSAEAAIAMLEAPAAPRAGKERGAMGERTSQ